MFHFGLAVPAFGSFTMNKEERAELLAKSQDAILERIDSKLRELKRSRGVLKFCRLKRQRR